MVSLKKLFTPVESLSPDQAKAFMETHAPGTYTLLDVRQHGEYETEHLPGAKLIPLPELDQARKTIDPTKPTLVYCAVGGRSRVAAQLLSGKGFDKVYNLSGGIKAWNGLKAAGPQELNLNLITGEESPTEIIAIGWQMEDSLGHFYRSAIRKTSDAEVIDLLTKLARVEEKHKSDLESLSPDPIDARQIQTAHLGKIMEGGFNSETLMQSNQHLLDSLSDVLELALMLETQAMDLYLRFADKSENPGTREVLYKIAAEEKAHLAALGKLYDLKL